MDEAPTYSAPSSNISQKKSCSSAARSTTSALLPAAPHDRTRYPTFSLAYSAPSSVYCGMTSAEPPWLAAKLEFGQVETPWRVALPMAKWVLSTNPASVFDPGAGRGILLRATSSIAPVSLCGMDIDSEAITAALQALHGKASIEKGDFLLSPAAKHPAIIANPPYIKSQFLNYTRYQWADFRRKWGSSLSGKTNIYALFLLKIWDDLAAGGRAAVIIPSEFLGANFGIQIKRLLLEKIRPAGIAVFNHGERIFQDALTTSCVVLLDKRQGRRPIWGREIHEVSHLDSFVEDVLAGRTGMTDMSAFTPGAKWVNCLVSPPKQRPAPKTVGDFFKCTRGIATGNNSFFTLSSEDVSTWNVNEFAIPCVCRSSDLAPPDFDAHAHSRLADTGKRAFLLSPSPADDVQSIQKYLDEGKRIGADKGFLASHRPIWYVQETRHAPDIFVGVFTRTGPKFIKNSAAAKSLTCYHGLYIKRHIPAILCKLIVIFMASTPGMAAFDIGKRAYGGGLSKLEPRDVESLGIPDWSHLTTGQQKAISDYWDKNVANPSLYTPKRHTEFLFDQKLA